MNDAALNVLIIDDEKSLCDALVRFVGKIGTYNIFPLYDATNALALIKAERIDLLITDVGMPEITGIELAAMVKKEHLRVEIILVSGQNEIIDSINALELGVYDFLRKPVDISKLATIIRDIEKKKNKTAVKHFELQALLEADRVSLDSVELPDEYLAFHEHIGRIVIASDAMKGIYRKLVKIHDFPEIPVLIEGRTGTGKEIIAKLIHYKTMGDDRPFVGINCAAIEKSLFESELFGYARGAFTGADPEGKAGKIELATGGSLFLDEITEISPDLQTKLLRVLQEKEYFQVGGNRKKSVAARIICATNKNIRKMIREGTFREDLYFRLDVCKVTIPPLARRREEIVPLALEFLGELNAKKIKRIVAIEGKALSLLYSHDWPGNVRQLKNAVTKAFLFSDSDLLTKEDFRFLYRRKSRAANTIDPDNFMLPDNPFELNKFTEDIIRMTLEKFKGNKSKTAEFLGLNRLQLYNRYKKILDRYADEMEKVSDK